MVHPKLYNEFGDHPTQQAQEQPVAQHTKEPYILGMSKRVFYIVLGVVALVVLAIALGVGLGIGLKKKSS